MGIVVTRKKVQKNLDVLKLKLLLQNHLTKRVVSDLLTWENSQLKAEKLLEAYSEGKENEVMGTVTGKTANKLLSIIQEGLGLTSEEMREAVKHQNVKATIINSLYTLDEFGLQFPMRFYAPLMVVWNFTYQCNLKCRHCYEDAGPLGQENLCKPELSREEKYQVLDQLVDSYIPTLSFSGGEPLSHPDFWPVAEKASEKGLYLSVNTNGTLITEEVARRFEELNFAYIAVSVDAPEAATHDDFRGMPGSWEKAVQGLKNVADSNVEAVISFTATRYNYEFLPQIFELGEELGVSKCMIYNFIPIGRGKEIVDKDLTPEMREWMLKQMYRYALEGGGVCSTAPQFGRLCQEQDAHELVPLAHTGPNRAKNLQVLTDMVGGCGMGRAYMALQPEGIITPCVYMPDINLGDIKENRILDVWHNSEVLSRLAPRNTLQEYCGVCGHREVCGGCRARAYAYFDDLEAPDPGCKRNARAFEKMAT